MNAPVSIRGSKALKPEGPFTIGDLARRWRTSEQHVIDLIDEGKIRALNIAGNHPSGRRFWRVAVEAVEKFEAGASNLAVHVKPADKRRP